TGILVEIERRKGLATGTITDSEVKIVKNGVIGSENKATADEWVSTFDIFYSYGGSADLWSETWTPAQINSPDFGFVLSTIETSGVGTERARVDSARVTVYFNSTGSVAPRDANYVPVLMGVSSVDGVTPVPVYADSSTGELLIDST